MEQLAANSNCGAGIHHWERDSSCSSSAPLHLVFTCLRLRCRLGLGLGTSLARVLAHPAPPCRAGPDLRHPLQEPRSEETHIQENLPKTGSEMPSCSCACRQGRAGQGRTGAIAASLTHPPLIQLATHRQALKSPFFPSVCFTPGRLHGPTRNGKQQRSRQPKGRLRAAHREDPCRQMSLRAHIVGRDHNSNLLGPTSSSDQAGTDHSLLLAQRHLGWVKRALVNTAGRTGRTASASREEKVPIHYNNAP